MPASTIESSLTVIRQSRYTRGTQIKLSIRMDFTYTPAQEKFRAELAGWLEKNSAEAFGRKGEGLGGSTASLLDVRDDSRWAQLLDYHRRLYKAGYAALHWPKEWGGGGASMIEPSI